MIARAEVQAEIALAVAGMHVAGMVAAALIHECDVLAPVAELRNAARDKVAEAAADITKRVMKELTK